MRDIVRTGAVLGALAAVNVLAHRSRLDADVVVPVGAAALLVSARASGLTWAELGLARHQSRGALPATGAGAAMTAATVLALANLPGTAAFRTDSRYPDLRTAGNAAFGTIPASVAVPEEVLFRSVLDAALRRHLTGRGADALGAVAFGLWHVLGAVTLTRDNAGVGTALGELRFGPAAGVVGTVLGTTVAGLGFTALRRRSGSILPGVAVHWSLNASGALAAGMPRRSGSCSTRCRFVTIPGPSGAS